MGPAHLSSTTGRLDLARPAGHFSSARSRSDRAAPASRRPRARQEIPTAPCPPFDSARAQRRRVKFPYRARRPDPLACADRAEAVAAAAGAVPRRHWRAHLRRPPTTPFTSP
jgi:hypothetical protein